MPSNQKPSVKLSQVMLVIAFFFAVAGTVQWVYSTAPKRASEFEKPVAAQPAVPVDPAEVERCKIPDFAKAIGHEEKWKLHNNCK
jgi:hypothetical protein